MRPMVSIDDACALVTDGTHFTPKDKGVGVPFLTVKDVSGSGLDFNNCSFIGEEDYCAATESNCAPRRGDVLFSKDGTVGKVHVVKTDQRFAVLSSLAILRPHRDRVDADYLGHALRSPSVLNDALKRKTGSAIRRIILSDLKQIRVFLPPIAVQRQIAEILDKADTLRAKRRAALAQIDTLSQSIFLEMFGDPASNPKGFPTTELGNVCTRITDGTHQPPTWTPSGNPFLFVSNVINGEITFDTEKFISDETHEELTRRCPIDIGDVLYSTVGSYGVPAVVRTARKFAFQRHIAHLKPDRNVLDPEFLRAMLASPPLKRQADRAARGAAQKTVNLADIRKFLVFSPPLKLQREFARQNVVIERLSTTQHRSAIELEGLFASIQHRAFNGEM
jgi:type I restriction enzyme S subunit